MNCELVTSPSGAASHPTTKTHPSKVHKARVRAASKAAA